MSNSVLITGACGFAGRYMCEYLKSLDERPKVIGIDLQDDTSDCDIFYKIDMADHRQINEVVTKSKPTFVIHLAGMFGTDSVQGIFRVNALSILSLLEAIRINCPQAVIVAAGSAAEYGNVGPETLPVNENTPCRPVTQYGLSKKMATEAAMYYHRVHNLNISVVRPFQLIGKGVSDRLAPGAFVKQLNDIIFGKTNVIRVGNLESSRDFLDIHDAVEGIWALCKKPAAGQIFNLCSGKPTKIKDLLDLMIISSGLNVEVQTDTNRLRGAADVSVIYGSFDKLNRHTGWHPVLPLSESVSMMFSGEDTV